MLPDPAHAAVRAFSGPTALPHPPAPIVVPAADVLSAPPGAVLGARLPATLRSWDTTGAGGFGRRGTLSYEPTGFRSQWVYFSVLDVPHGPLDAILRPSAIQEFVLPGKLVAPFCYGARILASETPWASYAPTPPTVALSLYVGLFSARPRSVTDKGPGMGLRVETLVKRLLWRTDRGLRAAAEFAVALDTIAAAYQGVGARVQSRLVDDVGECSALLLAPPSVVG